jgi:hypothetical protein
MAIRQEIPVRAGGSLITAVFLARRFKKKASMALQVLAE